jgi:anti-sigma regulatory factor (Ser/Thr protein kinase)
MENRETRVTESVDLILSLRPQAAKEARDGVDRLAERVAPEILDDVRLLVSELVTNSVRHGAVPQDGRIELRAALTSSAVRVEVVDTGGGFTLATRTRSADRAGGWGLYLVQRIASRWGIDSSGGQTTRVWFEIDREPSLSGLTA